MFDSPQMAPPTFSLSSPATPTETRSTIAAEYAIFAEYVDLSSNPCDGVFVVPSDSNPRIWQGTIAIIDDGPYDGALLRFTLSFRPAIAIPERPRLTFASPIFHPLIDPLSGEFDLAFLFAQWSNKIRMRQVLVAVRNAFTVIDPNGSRNPEAAALIRSSPKDYRTRVTMDIVDTLQDLSNDNTGLGNVHMNFGPWIPELYEPILKDILSTGAALLVEKSRADSKADRHNHN
ncbi:putative AKT-interacting protein [Hypsibius exemplaris]|uniref:AKT-interacting protein n=1 Tax=Hypsibius exemplaris TaxID=2072580 RepID=A0A1W0WWQ8_HYPEX|nr:putative AKT-interacting protein [Hypsibius exemplaris]